MSDRPEAKLYVIPGSHACRTGMLLLEHKGIPYRPVKLITGTHPMAVRALGFPGKAGRARQIGEGRISNLALADRLGTVPALRYGEDKVQGNREIARFLDRIQPDPPLFPEDAERRREVEEAELWGDEELQMTARRLLMAAARQGEGAVKNDGEDGRLGYLLFKNRTLRERFVTLVGARTFDVDGRVERELLGSLPGMLDRVDGWIEAGVLNGEQLNAADLMIAPSIALLSYRVDLADEIAARPAGALTDRLLPEPVLA